jgi:perosamine synthetase
MKNRIFYTKPSITKLEVSYATDAAMNGWGEHCYDYITRFEDSFKKHLNIRHTIATSSCTGALHMGLAALGVGPGDEVILADTNWIATAASIVHLGAKPIFVDILKDSWCLDPLCVERSISPKTKAIIATHIYGNLCDMNTLIAIGNQHNIPIVEDAAEAIGSTYRGRSAGSIGIFGTFSFHGTKTVTTGEGGMFVTNDSNLFEKVLTLSNHGRVQNQSRQFWPDVVGYKYKISNVQAAIGCAQMTRISELIMRKREIFQYYKNKLAGSSNLSLNPEPDGMINGYWMPTVVFSPQTKITREKLQSAFASENIDARVFFWPLSSLPMFNKTKINPNSYSIQNRAINLPSYHEISTSDQERVINVIQNLLNA